MSFSTEQNDEFDIISYSNENGSSDDLVTCINETTQEEPKSFYSTTLHVTTPLKRATSGPSSSGGSRYPGGGGGAAGGGMRKYSDNHLGGLAGGKNPGRKCISRAQMSEPYELSQDLLDKQVEALSNKYGGGLLPHNAANTIQRAYRRYTMDKKFKALTSSRNKTENRLSRRFANMLGGGGGDVSADASSLLSQGRGLHHGMDAVDCAALDMQNHSECCVYNNAIKTSTDTGGVHHDVIITGAGGTSSCLSPPSSSSCMTASPPCMTPPSTCMTPPSSSGSSSSSTTTMTGEVPGTTVTTNKSMSTLEEYHLHHQKLQHHYQQQLHAQRKQLQHHHTMQLQQQQLIQQQQHIQQQQQHIDLNSRLIQCGHHYTTSPSGLMSGGGGMIQHDCRNFNCTLSPGHAQWLRQQQLQQQQQQQQQQSAGVVARINIKHENSAATEEDEDHSDSEIKTYANDYLPDRAVVLGGGGGGVASSLGGGVASSRAAAGHMRVGGARPGHHSHCTNCALQSQQNHRSAGSRKRAPDVPKRTVSRLTSLDVEESSELYPARPGDGKCLGQGGHSRGCLGGDGGHSRGCLGGDGGHTRGCLAEQHLIRVCTSPLADPVQLRLKDGSLNTSSGSAKSSPGSSSTSSSSAAAHHKSAALHKQEINRTLTAAALADASSAAGNSRDQNRNLHGLGGSVQQGHCQVDSALGSSSVSSSRGSNGKDMLTNPHYTVNEVIRKRHYRTGLNIFNKKPEKGISYLITKGFLDNSPAAVARFLITRKGLSKQMIGDYLGNISSPFNMAVLNAFANEIDLSNSYIDVALRKFQTYFRMPGEAQKIERLMEVFSQRYCVCNPGFVSQLNSVDTVFILAFAIILLNTDLHTPNLKPEKRMKVEDFVRNLRGIDDGSDPDGDMLNGIYERIKAQEFKPGSDHVTQVMKVQQTIVVKCPNLAVPYRRLVCYCRLYEVQDLNKKDRPGQHQREVFLFNDILVITKIYSRRKNSVTYAFRNQFPLTGMIVSLFENSFYSHGITLTQRWDRKVVITLNARNDHDRSKFVEDLRESVAEMDEMEALRIEGELEKQHATTSRISAGGNNSAVNNSADNRDSGVNDCDSQENSVRSRYGGEGGNLKRSAINNSLLDLAENYNNLPGYPGFNLHDKPVRRGSVGSLDSGMSVSFQSGSAGSAGTVSQESSPQQQQLILLSARAQHHHMSGATRGKKLSSNMSTNL